MYKLICISGINLGDEFDLHTGQLTLGRDMDNDVCILDAKSSRCHCRICQNGNKLELEDLDSTNGTLINNQPLTGKVTLLAGDLIKIGNTTYQVYSATDSPEDMQSTAIALLGAQSRDLDESITLQITKTATIPKTNINPQLLDTATSKR